MGDVDLVTHVDQLPAQVQAAAGIPCVRLQHQRPLRFLMDGLIRIFLEDFSKWLEVNRNRNMDSHTLGRRMRQVSARPDKVNVYVGGGRTTRSVWVLIDEFRPPQRDMDEPRDGDEAGPDGGETRDESRDESRNGTEENGG